MVDLLHQREQLTQLALGKTRAGEPVELVARQIGDQSILVLAVRHTAGHQELQRFGVHRLLEWPENHPAIVPGISPWRKST